MLVMCEAMVPCVVCAAWRSAGMSEDAKNSDGCAAAIKAGTRASNHASFWRVPGSGVVPPANPMDAGALPLPGRACPPARGERRAGRGETLRGLAGLGRGVNLRTWPLRLEERERALPEDPRPQLLAQPRRLQGLVGFGQGQKIRRSLPDVAGEHDPLRAVPRDQRSRGRRIEEPRLQREPRPAAHPARERERPGADVVDEHPRRIERRSLEQREHAPRARLLFLVGSVDDRRPPQPRRQLELPREDLLLPLAALLQAELPERDHPRVVEVVRQPLQQLVDAVPGDAGGVQRQRHHRADSGDFEAAGLDPHQLVPVLLQIPGTAGAGVPRAGHRRFHAEVCEGSEIRAALALDASPGVVVVGHQAETVQEELSRHLAGAPLRFALQAEQLGTGHAVLCAEEALRGFDGSVLILAADVPLIRPETLQKLVIARQGADLALLTCRAQDPKGYGRIVRRGDGSVARVVEEKDASPEERRISEANASIYLADAKFLFRALRGVGRSNAQGEYYLTDIVAKGRAVAV